VLGLRGVNQVGAVEIANVVKVGKTKVAFGAAFHGSGSCRR
jgi:hypothetical protein